MSCCFSASGIPKQNFINPIPTVWNNELQSKLKKTAFLHIGIKCTSALFLARFGKYLWQDDRLLICYHSVLIFEVKTSLGALSKHFVGIELDA